jgi:glutamine amidotransferase
VTAQTGKIAIVDSGVANLASVNAAIQRLGAEAEITSDAKHIRAASHVILPGVGAAATAMRNLRQRNLPEVLCQLAQPVLGICLGMQLLFVRSHEGTGEPVDCLSLLSGEVTSLRASPQTPVPHMGWNQLSLQRPYHALLRGIDDGSFVYFVHSYAMLETDAALATTEYGQRLAAVVAHKNFFGCQFHPERSGAIGARILENFLDM